MSKDGINFYMVEGGPTPVAPFSHATESGGFVFVTGQMPDQPGAPGILPETIEEQTANVMSNLTTVLNGLDLSLEDVVMVRVFLTRFQQDYERFNHKYKSYFAKGKLPAHTCVGVTGLAYDALVEIDLIVRRPAD